MPVQSRRARWRGHLFTPTFPPLVLGFIGDSITGGALASDSAHYAASVCGALLAANWGTRSVTVVNQGVSGTVSHDWIPTFGTHYTDAAAAFTSAGVTLTHLMLGTNDSKTAGVDFLGVSGTANFWLTNVTLTVTAELSAGRKVILSGSPYIDFTNPGNTAWSAESDAALVAIQAVLNGLVDGVNVFQGDQAAYSHFQANQAQLIDGVHPGDVGHAYLGGQWASAVAAALGF